MHHEAKACEFGFSFEPNEDLGERRDGVLRAMRHSPRLGALNLRVYGLGLGFRV